MLPHVAAGVCLFNVDPNSHWSCVVVLISSVPDVGDNSREVGCGDQEECW